MADPLGSLEKIVKLALRIKEAVDTVRHNKEECQQIRTRAVRVSSLLSRLPETGITGDPAMCDALGDLEDALRHAHALVTACQQSSTVCLYCTAGKQARRLRRVQDDISQKVMLVVFATNIHTTIILTNNICSRDPLPPAQVMGAMITQPVVVPASNSSADDASLFEYSTLEPSMRRTAGVETLPNVNFSFQEEVEANNVPMASWSPSRWPSASAPPEELPDDLFPVMPSSLPQAQLVPLPQAPQVATAGSGLSTVIKNELTKPGIRLAARVVTHSLFPSDSSTEMQEADDSARARLLAICHAIEQEEELPEPWNDMRTPTFKEKILQSKSLREFSFSELEAATHQFSVQNLVGSGSFATVYKGVLHDGLLVAVKKFQHPNVLSAGNKKKLHLLSKLKHSNIVKLIGYSGEVLERTKCFDDGKAGATEDKGTSYLLVEEYMPNGSLDKTMNNGMGLDWSSRFRLIQGIAHGLCYLHERDVIHLDVKPGNILLDSDMNPKITDFGLAKVLKHKGVDFGSDISTIEGTLGYMPPEYITDGTLSKKHDVYGFGVTLLDIVSSMSRCERATGQASIEWAWQARQAGGGMMELLDPSLFDAPQLKEIERCVEVGLLCTQFNPADRPDMMDALEMLRGEKALRTPVRPGYTKEPAASWLHRWGCLRAMRL